MLTYWKSSRIWQLKVEDEATYQTYIQVVYFGHVEIQLVNGAFQFASVDIAMDQMTMYLRFLL